MSNAKKILEYTWLAIAIISAFTAIHAYSKYQFSKDVIVFIVVVLLSLLMYKLRRAKRKNTENKI